MMSMSGAFGMVSEARINGCPFLLKPGSSWTVPIVVIFMILFGFCPTVVAADGGINQGALRSGRDDRLRFDLHAGLANPSPAIAAEASVLLTKYPWDALGIAAGFSKHEMVEDNAQFADEHLDAVWEHSWPIITGYHAFRVRGGLGIARAHRAMDKTVAQLAGEDANRIYWGAHVCASMGFDIPVADLVWARLGLNVQKILLERTPTQTSVIGGLVWGGQWFGIGD
jgi:hypothetical protein